MSNGYFVWGHGVTQNVMSNIIILEHNIYSDLMYNATYERIKVWISI